MPSWEGDRLRCVILTVRVRQGHSGSTQVRQGHSGSTQPWKSFFRTPPPQVPSPGMQRGGVGLGGREVPGSSRENSFLKGARDRGGSLWGCSVEAHSWEGNLHAFLFLAVLLPS